MATDSYVVVTEHSLSLQVVKRVFRMLMPKNPRYQDNFSFKELETQGLYS